MRCSLPFAVCLSSDKFTQCNSERVALGGLLIMVKIIQIGDSVELDYINFEEECWCGMDEVAGYVSRKYRVGVTGSRESEVQC